MNFCYILSQQTKGHNEQLIDRKFYKIQKLEKQTHLKVKNAKIISLKNFTLVRIKRISKKKKDQKN